VEAHRARSAIDLKCIGKFLRKECVTPSGLIIG
jgi:hypothetical protein